VREPDYSIIVPAYNEADFLPESLRRIRAAMAAVDAWRGELIVCDNNSSDGTAELAREAGARVVHEAHNQIARARNAGGHAAAGRYLIWLDADSWPSPALLQQTLACLAAGGVVGGGTMPKFDRRLNVMADLFLLLWKLLSRGCGWACGCYVFCLREAFEATGGFDERYYASEEIHFSAALKQWGRARGLRFRLLRQPVITSVRKADWYGNWGLLYRVLCLAVRPWALRRRDACGMWYTRPDGPSQSSQSDG